MKHQQGITLFEIILFLGTAAVLLVGALTLGHQALLEQRALSPHTPLEIRTGQVF